MSHAGESDSRFPGPHTAGHSNGMDSPSSPRYRFDGTCQIAPWIGAQLSREAEFLSVKCYNLPKHGIAFLLHNPPTFNTGWPP